MFAQLVRFGGVGAFATVVHVLTAVAVQRGLMLSAQPANLIGFATAVLVSYFGQARFTFGADPGHTSQFLRFVCVSLVGLATSSLTVWLATSVLGLDFSLAMVAVAVLVPAATYLAMRFWVFADRK